MSILFQNAAFADDSKSNDVAGPAETAKPSSAQAGKTTPEAPAAKDGETSSKDDAAAKAFEKDDMSEDGEGKKAQHKPFYKRLFAKFSFWKLSYYFVAQNPSNCDLLYGLVVDNPAIGRATLNFAFANGCDCHGIGQVTHYPLFKGGAGQKGYIKAKCSDGRTMKGKFTTTSVTTGNGTVTDSLGNQYQFTFGQTADQAVQQVNILRKQLGCPEVTGEEIELKVHAEVLKKK
jgi:hypothetical protein